MRTIATTVAAGMLISAALGAQLQPADVANPTFDVISVKPNRSTDGGFRWLLADRFKLAAHYETQERPIYHLVIARADGRTGPQLRRIDIDCATFKQPTVASGQPAPPADELRPCTHRMRGGATLSIVSGGRTMQFFADLISGYAARPVLDKTGLTGYYAFTLDFGLGNDDLSVFTALQEQLGLKLEPARGPLDVVAIDRIERPTEN